MTPHLAHVIDVPAPLAVHDAVRAETPRRTGGQVLAGNTIAT